MDARSDLLIILAQIDAMLPRFSKGQSGLYMANADQPVFTQLVAESKIIFDEELGRANDISLNIVRAANVGVSNFIGSPSYHSVQQVAAFIRAGISQLERRARRVSEGEIPASNRYVALNDNQRIDVTDALGELKNQARGSNELQEEERIVVLSEIAAFEATIVQPRVSSDLIQRFVDMVLGWLSRTFTVATVQEVAHRLIAALMKLLATPSV